MKSITSFCFIAVIVLISISAAEVPPPDGAKLTSMLGGLSVSDMMGKLGNETGNMTAMLDNVSDGYVQNLFNSTKAKLGGFPGPDANMKKELSEFMKTASSDTKRFMGNGTDDLYLKAEKEWSSWNETTKEKWTNSTKEVYEWYEKKMVNLIKRRTEMKASRDALKSKFGTAIKNFNIDEGLTAVQKNLTEFVRPGNLKKLSKTEFEALRDGLAKTLFNSNAGLPTE